MANPVQHALRRRRTFDQRSTGSIRPAPLPTDSIGDANHDGVRSSSDDEFVELVNSTSHDLDISGLSAAGAKLRRGGRHSAPHVCRGHDRRRANRGSHLWRRRPNPSDPVFGSALVFEGLDGRIVLEQPGGIVTLRDNSGAVANIFEYGGATGLSAGSNQSLTRSPDISGRLYGSRHCAGPSGKLFSPGTRVDGTPFADNSDYED